MVSIDPKQQNQNLFSHFRHRCKLDKKLNYVKNTADAFKKLVFDIFLYKTV